jgi:hypothetical protein
MTKNQNQNYKDKKVRKRNRIQRAQEEQRRHTTNDGKEYE